MPDLILAEDSWAVTLIIGIAILVGFAIITAAAAAVMLLRDVRTFVLPHFLPPAPGEEDVSLPAAVSKIKADIAPTNGDRSSISDRVDKARKTSQAVHAELEEYKAQQATEREERQQALDEKLDAGSDRFDDLERGQEQIRETLAAVCARLPELLAGNPEVRRDR